MSAPRKKVVYKCTTSAPKNFPATQDLRVLSVPVVKDFAKQQPVKVQVITKEGVKLSPVQNPLIQATPLSKEKPTTTNVELLRLVVQLGQKVTQLSEQGNKLSEQVAILIQRQETMENKIISEIRGLKEEFRVRQTTVRVRPPGSQPPAKKQKTIERTFVPIVNELPAESLDIPDPQQESKASCRKLRYRERSLTPIIMLPDFPIQTLEEMDETIENMADPEYKSALRECLARPIIKSDKDRRKRFAHFFSDNVLVHYNKKGANGLRASHTCPMFNLLKEVWTEDPHFSIDAYELFLTTVFHLCRNRAASHNKRHWKEPASPSTHETVHEEEIEYLDMR